MELQLKNIGMIKEANVKLDGLTVIAGENDTGKSTVGKALFVMLRSTKKGFTKETRPYQEYNKDVYLLNVDFLLEKLFKQHSLEKDGYISLNINGRHYSHKREDRFVAPNIGHETTGGVSDNEHEIIFIETPLVWSFVKFFNEVALVESQMKLSLEYPYLLKDLHFKLAIKSNQMQEINISSEIASIIEGLFIQDKNGDFFFYKDGEDIEMVNTATGIKSFGILQILSNNNHLNSNTVLVLDEPEVHLHPKWQLEMAKVIVELVKNGVKILVNSHSPYMIEALQRYSELAEVNSDFYLAEDGYIKKENDSNSETLAKIFEKLSEPFDVFEEMESQKMENFING